MRVLARALIDQAFAEPSFEAALLEREARSPTGLPLEGRKVALPHADPEHVRAPAVALCTLAHPVLFREMGAPERELPVELVAVLALPDHESVQRELVALLGRFQDPAFVERLCAAADADDLLSLLLGEPSP